jgi:hypothetical protein
MLKLSKVNMQVHGMYYYIDNSQKVTIYSGHYLDSTNLYYYRSSVYSSFKKLLRIGLFSVTTDKYKHT